MELLQGQISNLRQIVELMPELLDDSLEFMRGLCANSPERQALLDQVLRDVGPEQDQSYDGLNQYVFWK